jgi:predicted lipoprotein
MRFFLALALLVPFAAAADPAAQALRFADKFAVPRFQAVAAAAHAQQSAWTDYCAGKGKPAALKSAFNDTADAWADVEFVHIGPAAIALRGERINYWLDRTDATGKALTAMLADPASLAPEKLAAGSVAGQGLPLLERLLAEKKIDKAHCAVGVAVAASIASIADAIATDWTAPDGARAALAANTRWRFAFADSKEAASVMLTDLAAGLESLKDFQVAMLFHDVANPKAPRLAEGAHSGRTLRDIERNLTSIRAGLEFFLADAPAGKRAPLDKAFDDAERSLKTTASPTEAKVALDAFANLSLTAIAVLPDATGLALGFNNLDGD